MNINTELKQYIDSTILPKYIDNIGGHDIDHIKTVVQRSFEIVKAFQLDVNPNMVYTIAAFHDIGYKMDPDNHEQISAELFLQEENLKNSFHKKK